METKREDKTGPKDEGRAGWGKQRLTTDDIVHENREETTSNEATKGAKPQMTKTAQT